MNKQLYRFLGLSFALIIFSAAVFAQSSPLTVEIPFNFYLGNEKVSSGKYELQRIATNIFLLRNEKGSVKLTAQTPLTIEEKREGFAGGIIFNRYGDKYFLRQIFTSSGASGRALYESKTERMIRQGLLKDEEFAKKSKADQIAVKFKTN